MTPRSQRIALRAVLACGALAFAPAAASASTWTVDDDRAQCSDAAFTSIQDAVDHASPNDTIIVCDGLYQESSIPANGQYSPAQAGSRNGLTIQKPVTIKGTGASKVIIEPAPELGDSLAGTTPYLRDGGGNVISIIRQSLGSSDDNEMLVDISGVTVRSPYSYAEAGVAYFNTSGTISDSVIGPLRRSSPDTLASRPYGWGVVMTNFMQGSGPGSGTVRREVRIDGSKVTGYQAGGVLFDGARGADGTSESAARAGITQYGYVTDSEIVGGGPDTGFGQTGVKYFAGVRGGISDSAVRENLATGASPSYTSYGVYLQDAETGNDVDVPGTRALTVAGTAFTRNRIALSNADLAGTAVRLGSPVRAAGNWWGCAAGPIVGGNSNYTINSTSYGCQGISGNDAGTPAAASVETAPISTAVPVALSVPAPVADAAPTAVFREPTGTPTVSLGDTISPVVVARDDFGVKSVELRAGGASVATLTKAPYEFAWSPAAADAGTTVTLSAIVTDSSGKTTTASVPVNVKALPVPDPEPTPTPTPTPPVILPTPTATPAPPAPKPPVVTASPLVIGDVTVGDTVSCVPGTWLAEPTGYAYSWLRAGAPIAGASSAQYEVTLADTASLLACTVTATNADGSAAATSLGRLASFPLSVDDETERQVGPGVVTVPRSTKASTKTGKATIGSFACLRAIGGSCTITLTGSVKIGAKSYGFPKVTVTGTGTKSLEIVLSKTARTLLKNRAGTLSVTIAATDATGFKSAWRTSLAVTKK